MIEAIGFRVVIQPDPVMETTRSGIVLALDTKLEAGATQAGTVVSVGPEAFRAYNRAAGFEAYVPWVKPGDHVSFAKYAGKWVTDPSTGVEYLVMNDEDIVCKVPKVNYDVATEDSPDQTVS